MEKVHTLGHAAHNRYLPWPNRYPVCFLWFPRKIVIRSRRSPPVDIADRSESQRAFESLTPGALPSSVWPPRGSWPAAERAPIKGHKAAKKARAPRE